SSFAPCPRGSGRWERVLYPGAGGLRLHAWLVPRHGGAVLLPPWRGPRLLDAPSPPGSSPTVPHAASFPCSCTRNSSPCAARHSPPSSSRRWTDFQAYHAHLAGQAQYLKEQRPKRRQMDFAEIADRPKVRRIDTDDSSKGQIAFAGSRD